MIDVRRHTGMRGRRQSRATGPGVDDVQAALVFGDADDDPGAVLGDRDVVGALKGLS